MIASPAAQDEDSIPIEEGDVLAGKYRVERVIGTGGMGVVVSAMHLQLDERVALKFLRPGAQKNPEAVARFAREARAAAKIRSEHVARVFDVGTLDTGSPYLVMEYLDGEDLAVTIEKRGPLPAPTAVELILQACEAIAEAHTLGIVHRDLKPGNLFLAERSDGSPAVKVLDFGISKVSDRVSKADSSLTRTRSVMGSPLYMAPEQMRASRDADPRSDIWALGMILHEAISGDVAFQGDTIPEICISIMQDPPKLSEVVPEPLRAVIGKCLEKEPSARFQSVADFANALVPFGTERSRISLDRVRGVVTRAGVTSGSLEPPPTSVSSTSLGAARSGPQVGARSAVWTPSGRSRSRARVPLLAGGIALVGAALMYVVLSRFVGARPNENVAVSASARPVVAAEAHPAATAPAPVAPAPSTAPAASAAPTETADPPAEETPPAAEETGAPATTGAPSKGAPAKKLPLRPAAKPAAPSAKPSVAPAPPPTNLFDDPK